MFHSLEISLLVLVSVLWTDIIQLATPSFAKLHKTQIGRPRAVLRHVAKVVVAADAH